MNTTALIMMSIVWSIVIFLTAFFFIKVLKSPKRPEPDSFSDNDDNKIEEK